MKNESVYKTARTVSVIVFALGVLEFIIFSLAAGFGYEILLGVLYGCTFAAANFFFLAYCVQKSTGKGARAQGYMGVTYSARMLFTAAMVIFAAKSSYLNIWAAIIPLVFPRIAVFLYTFLKRGEKA